jgi:hypothetical protein
MKPLKNIYGNIDELNNITGTGKRGAQKLLGEFTTRANMSIKK